MPRGKKGPVPDALPNGVYGIPTPPPDGLAEPATAEQSELFKEPGIVKWLTVPLSAEVVNEKRQALAELYQQGLDVMDAKKTADKDFNAQLATIETMMRGIAKTLAAPTEEAEVECEWRVIDGNTRGLFRLDTGECLEKTALTAEDRAVINAEAANAIKEFAEDNDTEIHDNWPTDLRTI